MKLYEILKGSEYSLDMFSQEVIAELENRIIERIDKKGKTYPVVSCLVRNKTDTGRNCQTTICG